MDGIKFKLSDPLTTIKFGGEVNARSNEVRYTSKEQQAKWEITDYDGGEDGRWNDGTVHLGFTWAAKGFWKDKSTLTNPNLLGVDWISDKNWTVTTYGTRDEFDFTKLGFVARTHRVPDHFKGLTVPGPDVNLKMDSLDYFLTTNLLYPGRHIFKADNPASESTSKGLALPRDLILTGEVSTS